MRSDFYDTLSGLPDKPKAIWERFRAFLLEVVQPTIDDHWNRGVFPQHVVKPFGDFLQREFGDEEFCFPPKDPLAFRLMKMELGRIDPSMASFFAVHYGLAMGSIHLFGSTEQKQRWIPAMSCMDKIGSWALTEPLAGSDAAFGLQCTAEQTETGWTLNGEKKWSGNASMADVIVIWAVEPKSKRMLGFLVEPGMPGLHIEKIHDKIAKRAMENVLIRLENVSLLETQRLPNVESFKQVGLQLLHGRIAVAWEALGIGMGALEAALRYTDQRNQFGKPISSFQLVQEKLVNMVEEVTCMQTLLVQLHHTEQRNGRVGSAQASLAKRACCRRARRVCALAREVLGGNGILLEYGVARLFADMEAVYSYEGTDEMNTLIVGRSLTGHNAFV
ncbi:MAG: acyl-CoA dehydrogenase family protein [Myxococcota bacterium]|nr:acyl-CoA dehydrogenase family protein [Myxococcota bacterium]